MYKVILFISLMFLPVLSSFGQIQDMNAYRGLYDSETGAAMRTHVSELSAAFLEGRKAGSEGETAAAEYVTSKFKEYGLELL